MSRTGDHTQETMSEDGLVPRDTRVFCCEYCGKDFGQGENSQISLKSHIQSKHLRNRKYYIIT